MIVNMSGERLGRILDAAYTAFTRHGVRRTTMDDIAAAAGVSRPALYQHVRNKDDAFRRLAQRLYDQALTEARAGATGPGRLDQRLAGILRPKLALTLRLWHDSPHAAELLGTNTQVGADLEHDFTAAMTDLAASVVRDAAAAGEVTLRDLSPAEVAELALALTRGLEADLSDPRRPHRRLDQGLALLVAGLRGP